MTEEHFGLVTREGAPVPLTGVKVLGTIAGRGAKVKLSQVFENREARAIEAVYKFPLPEGGTVCRFRTVVGDRVTEGVVEEKKKAFELYDEALSRGDGACLLDEERPNIFTLSVGNLNPGASASVEIDYVTLLDAKGTEVRFYLPTTISPRYVPERTPDEDRIPADHKVNPPVAFEVPYGLLIDLEIWGRNGISSIESPSHPVSLKFEGHVIKAGLTSGAAAMDRDFVLTINYRDLFQNRGYFYGNEKGGFFQIDLCPTGSDREEAPDNKEVIFLLDCSGSMGGDSIHQAKTALEIFLKALKEGTRFNVYRFGSTYEKISPESLPYNPENLRLVLNRLRGIDADLGGTEVLAPLAEIYGSRVPDGWSREVILITDGQIGNESEILNLVKRGNHASRLFTVGIGYGPNEYFIRQLTRVTGGTSEMIAPGERIEPKILRLFKQVMSRRIDGLKIRWGEENLQAEQAPIDPSLFAGETVSILARVNGSARPVKEVTLSFEDGRGGRELIIPIHELQGEGVPVDLLWAREKVRDLEEGASGEFRMGSRQTERREDKVRDDIIRLSMEFGILSRETSFVAVEKRVGDEKTTTEVVLRKIPVMLTRGWGGVKTLHCLVTPLPHAMPWMMDRVASYSKDLHECNSVAMLESLVVTRKKPVDDVLMRILASQRAEGGFEIDRSLARSLRISMKSFERATSKLELQGEGDRPVLLSTAIILQVLKRYFADRQSLWGILIEKTEKWFQGELGKNPKIEGVPLSDWAFRFTKTLKIKKTV